MSQPCRHNRQGFPRVLPSRRKVPAGAETWTQTGARFSLLFQRKRGSAGFADTSRINAGRSCAPRPLCAPAARGSRKSRLIYRSGSHCLQRELTPCLRRLSKKCPTRLGPAGTGRYHRKRHLQKTLETATIWPTVGTAGTGRIDWYWTHNRSVGSSILPRPTRTR